MNSLRMVSKAAIGRLKEGEEEKRKRYTALCVTAVKVEDAVLRGLDNQKDLVLQQVLCTQAWPGQYSWFEVKNFINPVIFSFALVQ